MDSFACPICGAHTRPMSEACSVPSAAIPCSRPSSRNRRRSAHRSRWASPGISTFSPSRNSTRPSRSAKAAPRFSPRPAEAEIRHPPVFAKNEAMNPTGSFKDRGSIVAIHKAKALGFKTVGTISTGNMAGSTAAYAAKAGLRSVIFVKEDTSKEKILAAADLRRPGHQGPGRICRPVPEKLRDRPGPRDLFHELRRSLPDRRLQGHGLRNLRTARRTGARIRLRPGQRRRPSHRPHPRLSRT